ncbi:Inner membrane component of T3SS domain-containing protein [Kytococcus aerolatus]|uniref:Inner membrane component of T3SS domain-containing protein n=1 Tax=Kytococcus aerolatus TaxID=592308 RepID=A0A212T2D8_9MICO|nr:FHA domain-containing protein [Kytococcus aerolatus]SNC60179.1 Inner membrane component of T3SS domain-containing protein [Kytococcus aerolatus]
MNHPEGPGQQAWGPATARIDVRDDLPSAGHGGVSEGVPEDLEQVLDALRPGTALLVIPAGPSAGSRYLLDEDRVTVGRAPEAEILLDDVTVSRQHAAFERGAEGFSVVDTGSTNGTYVNGEETGSSPLVAGDLVQIGKYRLVFHPARTGGGA